MHIERGQMICGYPVLDVRMLFRKYGASLCSEKLVSVLGATELEANELISLFLTEGYIESEHDYEPITYRLTTKGNALRMASAAKQITRATAIRILRKFMAHVIVMNHDPFDLFKVAKIVVFGSLITDAERLSDIDIGYELRLKPERLPTLGWDIVEQQAKNCIRFLARASRYINMHDINNDGVFQTCSSVLLYDEENPIESIRSGLNIITKENHLERGNE